MKVDENFWTFSCTFYAQGGIAETCLELQDRYDLDVNLLLFCLWYGGRYGEIDTALWQSILQASGQWRTDVVKPLRTIRRRMKKELPGAPAEADFGKAQAALRERIKQNELAAEKIQQDMLQHIANTPPGPPKGADNDVQAISRNLLALQDHSGVDANLSGQFEKLITAMTT